MIEVYDSEMPKIDAVVAALGTRQGQLHDLEDYRREVIDRFARIGFRVEVLGTFVPPVGREWDAKLDGAGFRVDIIERISPSEFDYDRQSYEIIHDVAGIEPDKKDTVIGPNSQIRSAPSQH
jgi:hypothetical protein